MSSRLFVALLLAACAGPAAHRSPATEGAEGVRLAVATTLAPTDPLEAPNCGLPTAGEACSDVASPGEQTDPHQHHHHGAAPEAPAPKAPAPPEPAPVPIPAAPSAEPPAKPKTEEHRHQHPAPSSSSSPAKARSLEGEVATVRDPVCGMTITPATAKGGTATLHGTQHYFCSSSCRRTFLTQNPEAK